MKKTIVWTILIMSAFVLIGCSSKAPQVPLEPMSEKFRFEKIAFQFDQKYPTKIQYQSPEALEKRINDKIIVLMVEKGLLSNDTSMDTLKIDVGYYRGFVGEGIPLLATESLAPPTVGFDIRVIKGEKEIRTIKRYNLMYDGGLLANLSVMAGANRDNEYENKAADALAKEIVNRIEKLR